MADSDHAQPKDPPWLKFAFKELALHIKEKPGVATNKRIEQYLQSTRKGSLSSSRLALREQMTLGQDRGSLGTVARD